MQDTTTQRPLGPFYHGTRYRFRAGQELSGGVVSTNQGFGGPPDKNVYATTDLTVAATFAAYAYGREQDPYADPYVYMLDPASPVEKDPNEVENSYRAARWRVVRSVPRVQWLAYYHRAGGR